MFRCLNLLLLLFCLVSLSENTDISVTGIKGDNVILTCELFEANKIVHIDLISESKDIDVCQTEECSGGVYKKEICDVVIKNLSFSDAGKYFLRVYYNNNQTNLAQQKDRMYQLHIHDYITVKIGKPLKLDVLLPNADKMEKNSSGVWTEVWKIGHGVCSNRMNDIDGNLIINEFMDSDAGTYRVLDSEGNILITVTVTESATESEDKLDGTDKDKTDDTEQHKHLIVLVGVFFLVLFMILVLISVIIMRRHLLQGYIQRQIQENPVL